MKKSLALASAILISGCAAVNNVTPAQKDENIQHVCVVKNPQVKIAETINIPEREVRLKAQKGMRRPSGRATWMQQPRSRSRLRVQAS